MNKDLLERWIRTMQEMARLAKGSQSFYNLFQD